MGKAPRILFPATVSAIALVAAYSLAFAQSYPPGAVVQPIPGVPQPPAGGPGQSLPVPVYRAVAPDPVDYTIAEWRRLQQSDGLGYAAYAGFISANPGWPGEDRMRRLAEAGVDASGYGAAPVLAFFARFPPLTATGQARHAFALAGAGRQAEARDAARRAWRQGTLNIVDEQRLLALFAGSLSPDDHFAHADIVLWAGDIAAAERTLGWLSPTRRPVIEARIAMLRRSPDAAMKVAAADPIGLGDAGYLAVKARWLRESMGDGLGARAILANRQPLAAPVNVYAAEKWYEALLNGARGAANDGASATAYAIASRVDDAFAPGTDISGQPFGVRDDYTNLTWLAGTTALNRLGRAAEAAEMFRRYAGGARSVQTRAKGYYWAGRASTVAGRASDAQGYFRQAAAYPDQYYGQLALERVGMPVSLPAATAVPVGADDRTALNNRSIVRAVRRLGVTGNRPDQTRLLQAVADKALTEKDQQLVADLARELSRPDLGVKAGRRAQQEGLQGNMDARFPRVSVPVEYSAYWTMIHAIARQESQFDRTVVSPVGARGLMQLMPRTAQEQAGKIGLFYSGASALDDPTYNVQLGSSYFQRMLATYGGSYPLAVAAYNAGGGNVNKWLAANGDPRNGGDWVQWVENIPFAETRNYVQRVLENAVVYDMLNPRNGGVQSNAPLSRYLGKRQPG